MCNKRYISKPKNKEIGSVSGKTDSPMSLLSCSRFSGWIPIWSMDAIPRSPSYSASSSPLIFLLHYPFLISLYLWLNMYFSKDTDSVPPPSYPPNIIIKKEYCENYQNVTETQSEHMLWPCGNYIVWNACSCFLLIKKAELFIFFFLCRGPAPVDPGWFEGGGTESASLEKYIFNHR